MADTADLKSDYIVDKIDAILQKLQPELQLITGIEGLFLRSGIH